jgi:hypothetical protein
MPCLANQAKCGIKEIEEKIWFFGKKDFPRDGKKKEHLRGCSFFLPFYISGKAGII